jgi:hypothetical protein
MDDQHLAIIRRRRVSDDCLGGSSEQPDGGRTRAAQGDGTSHFGGGQIQDADGAVGLVGDVGNVRGVYGDRARASPHRDSRDNDTRGEIYNGDAIGVAVQPLAP